MIFMFSARGKTLNGTVGGTVFRETELWMQYRVCGLCVRGFNAGLELHRVCQSLKLISTVNIKLSRINTAVYYVLTQHQYITQGVSDPEVNTYCQNQIITHQYSGLFRLNPTPIYYQSFFLPN